LSIPTVCRYVWLVGSVAVGANIEAQTLRFKNQESRMTRSRKLATQIHRYRYYLEVECVYLLLGEEEDTLGNAEYLVRGEGALQPQVLHYTLTSLQYSHVRAVCKIS
jgi:hypothetical protein